MIFLQQIHHFKSLGQFANSSIYRQLTVQFQMTYYNSNSYPNPLQTRVKQLEADKLQLSKAIEELNACYQQKIELLQNTISEQQQRYQEILEWKQNYIDRNLFDVEKYQIEIKKMIEILDNAHHHFENDKQELAKQIEDQQIYIQELKEENDALTQFNHQNQARIQEMVRTYTEEIQKLKQDLKLLREESMLSQDFSQIPLRDISSHLNLENIAPNEKNDFMGEDSAFEKYQVHG